MFDRKIWGIATPVCALVRNDRGPFEARRYRKMFDRKIRGIATPVCGLVRNDMSISVCGESQ